MTENHDTPMLEVTNAELEAKLGVSRRTVQRLRHRPGCPRAGDHATFEEYVAALRTFAGRVTPSLVDEADGTDPEPATHTPETPPLESLTTEPDADHPAADTGDVGSAPESVEPPAAEPATALAAPLKPTAHSESRADARNAILEAPGEPGGGDDDVGAAFFYVRGLADNIADTLGTSLTIRCPISGDERRPVLEALVDATVSACVWELKGVLSAAEWRGAKARLLDAAGRYGFRGEWLVMDE